MKQPVSSFATVGGLCILAVLILISAYFDYSALEAFLTALLLLGLAAFLWARFSLRRIEISVDGEDCRAFPGQTARISAGLRNGKLLPLIRLDLAFPAGNSCIAPDDDGLQDEDGSAASDKELCAAFLWVMPWQTIQWQQSAKAVARGVCRIDTVRLASGDGFGLCTREETIPLSGGFRYIIYPRLRKVDVSPIINRLSEMEAARNGFYTDRTLLLGTRDYRPGDSFKDINWRMMARQDELQTNIHEQLAMRRVCFIPELQSFTYKGEVEVGREKQMVTLLHKDEFENALSLIASLIDALDRKEVICSLVIPGYGERQARLVIPESRRDQVVQLFTALAEIDYENEETFFPVDEISAQRHRLGQIYMFSLNGMSPAEKQYPGLSDELGFFRVIHDDSDAAGSGRILKEAELSL